MYDIVTVFHNTEAQRAALRLKRQLEETSLLPFKFIQVDNRIENRGFAKACNLGARDGDSPFIGFLNPDLIVKGDITEPILKSLHGGAAVAGERFGKEDRILEAWGVQNWVCGAAFFVARGIWDLLNGFDEGYVWGHEETDFIRRVELIGQRVESVDLPVVHGDLEDRPEDTEYKRFYYEQSRERFSRRWGVDA